MAWEDLGDVLGVELHLVHLPDATFVVNLVLDLSAASFGEQHHQSLEDASVADEFLVLVVVDPQVPLNLLNSRAKRLVEMCLVEFVIGFVSEFL